MSVRPSSDVLDQVLNAVADCLTPEVAKRILSFALDPKRQLRIDALAQKANEGTLSEEERREYAEYVDAMDVVGILKATARLAVSRHAD